ncbi:glycogen synthase [Leptolinea sp. HRD-7]|nr:glycogen synthase [Leptolinea sp. HRD-7]
MGITDMKNPSTDTLKVLFAASEAEPFVKVGGLGDVAGTLPDALVSYFKKTPNLPTLDFRLFIPFHSKIPASKFHIEKLCTIDVPTNRDPIPAHIYLNSDLTYPVYLIAGEPLPADGPVYDPNPVVDGKKFSFFSLAVLEYCRQNTWIPDILHANDWHTALLPHLIRERNEYKDLFSRTKTLLSVHNLPFMGGGSQAGLLEMGIKPSKDFRLPKWSKHMPLPMGLAASDRILAVSPGYAREMLTPEYGCGLDGFLFTVTEKLGGILNGLDTTLWDPSHDPLLVKNYSSYTIAKRAKNKEEILTRLGLEYEPRTPLIIMVTRIDQQKGIDIALKALESIMERKFQLIILGVGDPTLEDACKALEELYPERVRFLQRFDQTLSHQLYSSGDIILIPSRYEPCGLTQMISMRYGCVPVARNTGGLSDTIIDTSPDNGQTGFLFQETTPESCARAIERALNMFINQDIWLRIQKNGMKMDFSWKKSAEKYANEYLSLRKQ